MKVLCISGKAGAGKDTYANYLADELRSDGFKVLITHYADLLKFVCKNFFDWDGEKDEHGRWLLQYVGTDVVRAHDKNYWADTLMRLLVCLEGFAGWDYVIIPDTRFENEIEVVKAHCFPVLHIRVEREEDGIEMTDIQKSHPSETGLDDAEYDLIVENYGDLQELREAAITTIIWMNGYHQTRMEEFHGS